MIRILFFLLCSTSINAQRWHQLNSCNEINALKILKGDTIFFNCDTTYLLSNHLYSQYKIYRTNLKNYESQNLKLQNSYEEIFKIQELQIKTQQESFTTLKKQFDQMVSSSYSFADSTKLNLSKIRDSLALATSTIEESKQIIEEANKNLKKAKKRGVFTKIAFGIGGLIIGATTVAIIVILKK